MHLKSMEGYFEPRQPVSALSSIETNVLFTLLNRGFGLYGPTQDGGSTEGACLGPAHTRFSGLNLTSIIGYPESPFRPAGPPTLLGYSLDGLNLPGWSENLKAQQRAAYLDAAMNGEAEQVRRRNTHLALQTLENHTGPKIMKEILQAYVDRFRFKHPTPDDFLALVSEKAGKEHAGLAETLLTGSGVLDFAVETAHCHPLGRRSRGFVTQADMQDRIKENFSTGGVTGTEAEGGWAWGNLVRFGGPETPDQEGPTEGSPTAYQWEVTVVNRGDLALPVDLLLTFEGGKTERRTWDGKGGELRLSDEGPDKLILAEIDPEAKYALDLNRLNNIRTVVFDDESVFFLAGWLQFWIQNYLNGWAFFG
jgi:hypothetical protein